MKKFLLGLIMVMLISINVHATTNEEIKAVFDQLAPNNAMTIDAYEPIEFNITYIEKYLNEIVLSTIDGSYYAEVNSWDKVNNILTIELSKGDVKEERDVTVEWLNDETGKKAIADAYNSFIEIAPEVGFAYQYHTSLQEFINFKFGAKSLELHEAVSVLDEYFKVGKLTYEFEERAGGEDAFSDSSRGSLYIYYDGHMGDMLELEIVAPHIIYVKDDVSNTDVAIIAAITEQINNSNAQVEVVGKRAEFIDEYTEEPYDFSELGDESKMTDNYYKVTLGDKVIYVVVIKDSSKVKTQEVEQSYDITYNFNGGTRQGKSEYVTKSVSVGISVTKEAFVDELSVSAPAGKVLDAIEINGTRVELGGEYFLNKNTVFKYLWKDVESRTIENKETNVKIIFTSEEIPDDVVVNVKEIDKKDDIYNVIKTALKTENFKAFDISLKSESKGTITKLSNGKFKVTVPLGKEYANKKMMAYYVKEDGTLEKYNVTMDKDGNATFETPHFSTYAFAEKTETADNTGEKVPQTYDGIMAYVIMLVISIVMTSSILVIKKRYN